MNNQFLDDIQNEIINAADKVFEDEDLIAEDINEDDEESEKARAQEFFKEDDKEQQVDEGNKVTAYQLFMSEADSEEDCDEIRIIPWTANVRLKSGEDVQFIVYGKTDAEAKKEAEEIIKTHKLAGAVVTNVWEKEWKKSTEDGKDFFAADVYEDELENMSIDEGDTSTMEGNDPLFMEYFGQA